MDCIFAHLWKTLASLPVTRGKEMGMLSAVDGRTKFYDPPLPNLLGNVLVSIRVPNIPTADLLKMPVSFIASNIREKNDVEFQESMAFKVRTNCFISNLTQQLSKTLLLFCLLIIQHFYFSYSV